MKHRQTMKALGSYADVLQGFANPQDDNLSTGSETQKEMTMNPYQGRKRQYIAVKTGMTVQSEQISEATESEKTNETTNLTEIIKELKNILEKPQQEAMDTFRSKILKETGEAMKELMTSMQQKLMAEVKEFIKISLEAMTEMLADLMAQNRAVVQM